MEADFPFFFVTENEINANLKGAMNCYDILLQLENRNHLCHRLLNRRRLYLALYGYQVLCMKMENNTLKTRKTKMLPICR